MIFQWVGTQNNDVEIKLAEIYGIMPTFLFSPYQKNYPKMGAGFFCSLVFPRIVNRTVIGVTARS